MLNKESIGIPSIPCKEESPYTSTDYVLSCAKNNQEELFHIVRNLVLTLSLVKIKPYSISSLLPCGKRSQYTTKKKTCIPNHKVGWGWRFYLPSKGEAASKQPNQEVA